VAASFVRHRIGNAVEKTQTVKQTEQWNIFFRNHIFLFNESDTIETALKIFLLIIRANLQDERDLSSQPQFIESGVSGKVANDFAVLFEQILNQFVGVKWKLAKFGRLRFIKTPFGSTTDLSCGYHII
jgi:hypothetical protein